MSAFQTKAWIHNYAEWTEPHLNYGDDTLVDFYDNNLEKNGNKSATYFFGRTQTYSDLDHQVRAAAAGSRLWHSPRRPRGLGSAELSTAHRRVLCSAQARRDGG